MVHFANTYRQEPQESPADIDASIAKLQGEIRAGDLELAQFRDQEPYSTFEIMKRATAWNHTRHRLNSELTTLQHKRQATMLDNTAWLTPSTFFVGSDS